MSWFMAERIARYVSLSCIQAWHSFDMAYMCHNVARCRNHSFIQREGCKRPPTPELTHTATVEGYGLASFYTEPGISRLLLPTANRNPRACQTDTTFSAGGTR